MEFNPVSGSHGRGWESTDKTWTIVMFGMGRYRLFHNPVLRTQVGEYKTLKEAEDWAARLDTLLKNN